MSKSGFDELAEIFGSTEAEGERKKAQEKPPKPKDRGSSTSSPAPTLKKEAGNGEEGARQENILGSEQQKHPVADSLRQEIRLILGISNKDLKWHEKEYELFRLLKEALAKIGCFYHTSEDDLLFFRLEDHNLYDIRETAFEHYLIWLTDNPRKVKNEWLPKLQARVRFTGFRGDVRSLLAAADVFVHTCESEAFGRAIAEAMAARLPVVAFATGGVPEIVVDGETGYLVPTGDTTAVAVCLSRLARDPHLRSRMGQNGCRRIATLFTAEQTALQVRQIIDEVLAR